MLLGVLYGVAVEVSLGTGIVDGVGGGVGTVMAVGTEGALAGCVRKGMNVKLPRLEWALKSEIVWLILASSVVPHQL